MHLREEIRKMVDKEYISHQSKSVNESHSRTFPIIQFLIVINLTYLGTIWSIVTLPYKTELALSVFMAVVNAIFAMTYIREVHINKIIRKEFYWKIIDAYGGAPTKIIRDDISKRDKMAGWTGMLFTGLVILVFMIPIITFLFLYMQRDPSNRDVLLFSGYVIYLTIFITMVVNVFLYTEEKPLK